MSTYLVTWLIDAESVDSPTEAAMQALMVQRDLDSTALNFRVTEVETGREWDVDLNEDGETREV